MKTKIFMILVVIELFIAFYGISAIVIVDYVISKEELRINKEWKESQNVHTVYENCLPE